MPPPAVRPAGSVARIESFVTVQVDDIEALRLSLGQRNGPLHIVRSTGALPVSSFETGPDVNEQSRMDRP